MDKGKSFGIIFTYPYEVELFKHFLFKHSPKVEERFTFDATIFSGILFDRPCVIAVGNTEVEIQPDIIAEMLIDQHNVDVVFLCGSFNIESKVLKIGDTVIASTHFFKERELTKQEQALYPEQVGTMISSCPSKDIPLLETARKVIDKIKHIVIFAHINEMDDAVIEYKAIERLKSRTKEQYGYMPEYEERELTAFDNARNPFCVDLETRGFVPPNGQYAKKVKLDTQYEIEKIAGVCRDKNTPFVVIKSVGGILPHNSSGEIYDKDTGLLNFEKANISTLDVAKEILLNY